MVLSANLKKSIQFFFSSHALSYSILTSNVNVHTTPQLVIVIWPMMLTS